MAYDNNLSGALFKNDKRESENHPLYKGSCEIEGVQYWVSGWMNKSSKGVPYMSLKFKAKEEQAKDQRRNLKKSAQQAQVMDDDFDDDIPF